MKCEIREQFHETNATEQHAFRIEANAQTFHLLLDKIYTNKPLAVVREAAQNAYDSHLLSGVKKPFTITLPTREEPLFRIRDYGAGMSEEFMLDGYCIVAHSTKRDSPTSVGGLGIGRLSMLSICDDYVVTTCHNKRRATWSVFLDEKRIPQISPVGSPVATFETGVELQIPIRQNEVFAFRTAAFEALRRFPTNSYELVGDDQKPVQYTLKAKTFAIRGTDTNQGPTLVMGPIGYPIDTRMIDFEEVCPGLSDRMQIDIFVPIGAVDIAPSREALDYNRFTTTKLKAILQRTETEIRLTILAHLKQHPPGPVTQYIALHQLKDAGSFLVPQKMLYEYEKPTRVPESRGVKWAQDATSTRLSWSESFRISYNTLKNPPAEVTVVWQPPHPKISSFRLKKMVPALANAIFAESQDPADVYGLADTVFKGCKIVDGEDYYDQFAHEVKVNTSSTAKITRAPAIYLYPREAKATEYDLDDLKELHDDGVLLVPVTVSRSTLAGHYPDVNKLKDTLDCCKHLAHYTTDVPIKVFGLPVSHKEARIWAAENLPTPDEALDSLLLHAATDDKLLEIMRNIETVEHIVKHPIARAIDDRLSVTWQHLANLNDEFFFEALVKATREAVAIHSDLTQYQKTYSILSKFHPDLVKGTGDRYDRFNHLVALLRTQYPVIEELSAAIAQYMASYYSFDPFDKAVRAMFVTYMKQLKELRNAQ